MLAYKLLLTPLFIGAISLAGRRWGPSVSGWLVGLPLSSGPVVFFFALEQGNRFASAAAQGALAGIISLSGFSLTYIWISRRTGWLGSILASWSAFFALTYVMDRLRIPLVLAVIAPLLILLVVLKLIPQAGPAEDLPTTPHWEVLVRMIASTAMVLILTGAAKYLGPHLSGLLTPFPVMSSVLAVFTQRFQGAPAATRLLRGLLIGLFTFATFFLVVALMIDHWGVVLAFTTATAACLFIHASSLFLMRKHILPA
jgi:uncharacterized membrane protein